MKLIIIGLLSGIISGMGIGGGSILIPALVLFNNIPQIEAQGINLIVFIPISIIALFIHKKEGNLELKYGKKIIIGGVIGATIGSLIALRTNPDNLRRYFGFFLLLIGIYEFFKKNRPNN
ncbi:sulfite exporter TauE/SafE family protein [Paratissierella segnis]|uniref:Probable membrane transporter protein n=1 Tax=Paratissierella segnis TaxID=2763679 RepID=A0A926IE66_9FIRM|nr:sulfite exporter TauE/SafE family protein [Paratissierella segnis]MBC8587037.1 sulfite exporter TauE/SafE family protein [Paratissierella segnis]